LNAETIQSHVIVNQSANTSSNLAHTKKHATLSSLTQDPDLSQTLNRPNITINRTILTPAHIEQNLNHSKAEEMEIQTEKKRRREEEKKSETSNNDLSQHFLSAGPGSQDCRDQ
jgi:hypothetical protein